MSDKMSPPTQELLLHIAEHTWCSADDLCAALPHQNRTQMLKRLGNLCDSNWLERYEEAGKTYWSVLPGSRYQLGKLRKSADVPVEAPAIVPPRRVNVMHGPTYQPAPAFTARPGALDASHIRSHGVRC